MDDCVLLPTATELVEMLRDGYDEEHGIECFPIHHHPTSVEKRAADGIKALLAENAKLKERCELLQGNNVILRGCVDKYNIEQIEKLREENAKLKAERDAALGDLRKSGSCYTCKHIEEGDYCERGCRWEWHGIKEEESYNEAK